MKPFILHLVRVFIVSALVLGVNTLGHSQPHVQPDFRHGLDSLRLKGIPHDFPNDMLRRTAFQSEVGTLPNKALSTHSQFYVIDTAIIRRLGNDYGLADTTRYLYSFDAKARMTSSVMQRLAGELWDNRYRWATTYDANGNVLTALIEEWSTSEWVNRYRYTGTYDAKGNVLTWFADEWSNGEWVIDGGSTCTYTYTYDANGYKLTRLTEEWSNGQWVNAFRLTFTYDTNGNMLTESRELWERGQWLNSERFTSTYDASANRLSYLWERWSDGRWVNDLRETYTYDTNGNMLSHLDEVWKSAQWGNAFRETCTYDGNGNLLSFWHHSWLNGSWVPTDGDLRDGIVDGAGNSYWYSGYNFSLTYRVIVTGIAIDNGTSPATYSLSQNYPNPFNPTTGIRYQVPEVSDAKLSVFDLLGREVAVLVNERKAPGTYEVTFDGSSLSSSVYFYRLTAGDFVQTKKLVLLK